MKRRLAALLALCALLLAGCAKHPEQEPSAPEPRPPVVEPVPDPEPPADDGVSVFAFQGLKIPIPREYLDQLVIESELETWNAHWALLASFSHRESVEGYEADYPGADADEMGVGWLCTVARLDRIGFEDWLSGERSGSKLFAADGAGRYYLLLQPTDVSVYRPGASWTALSGWIEGLPAGIVAENGLAAYDAGELFRSDYTYSGEHVELGYRFPGEPMDLAVLALSQPAKQGEGGVWCVERVRYLYSAYSFTDTQLVFPSAFGVDETAADYYARLQAECDAGEHPALLTPLGAALDYAGRCAWLFGEDVSETDFEVVDSLG